MKKAAHVNDNKKNARYDAGTSERGDIVFYGRRKSMQYFSCACRSNAYEDSVRAFAWWYVCESS